MPPSYSAIKMRGRKLYEWARSGTAVEAKPRRVVIRELRLLCFDMPEVAFFMTCGKGTYVRTLCDSMGKALGTGAALSALVRSRIGEFHLSSAWTEASLLEKSPNEIEANLIS